MPAPDGRERGIYTSEVRLELLKAVMEEGKLFRFRAPGFSMYPFIRNNDIVTLAPLADRCPRTGDIVAFIHPGTRKLVVHRIIHPRDTDFIIKGDNADEPDGLIPRENIFGTVIRIERAGRNVAGGLGYWRRVIALLSRYVFLRRIVWMIGLPRRVGGRGLLKAQEFATYRRFARKLRPDMTLCEADEKDMNAFHAQWNSEIQPEPYRHNPEVTNFVAKHGKTIFGFIQLVRHPDSHYPFTGFWLFSLMVRVPYRGMGLGRELSMRVILMAQEEGASELSLLVNEKNQPAIALYRDLQFEPVTIPGLEERLEEEYATTGKRRIAMRREFLKKPKKEIN